MESKDTNKLNEFDTDRFRREGRLHVENGYSLFDYVGAIFSPRDFQSGNEIRLQEKLDTVIDYEERFRYYEACHPDKGYFLVDAINTCPNPVISEEIRQQRRIILADEIQGKMAKKNVPAVPLPQEKAILDYLSRLPPQAQKWLFDSNYEIAFSQEKKIARGGGEGYDYVDMLATHPAARQHTGGGALTSYRPFHADAIKYVYSTLGRDPVALLAHEALGHGLFNAACSRGESELLQKWEQASLSDLGDINKIKGDNPTPNTGRLGALIEIISATHDDHELLARLRHFDPKRIPDFKCNIEAHQWLEDVRTMAKDTWPKLGPESWTYTQDCYRLQDGSYNRKQTLNEIGAIVGEQYFSIAQGKENILGFIIPTLTDFWEKRMVPLMDTQEVQCMDKKSWAATLGERTGRIR